MTLKERARKFGERVRPYRNYIRGLITDLFFSDPETLLTKIPSVYEKLKEDPSFIREVEDVVNRHKSNWNYATSLDLYDASVSAAQLASLLASYGIDVPVERLVEIVEAIPKISYIYNKISYIYKYAKRTGKLPAALPAALLLALYELISFVDVTNLMDLLPAYRAAELYSMYKELMEPDREPKKKRVFRTSESFA